MSEALINRSLTNIRTELDFLLENKVISKDFYDEFNNRLPKDSSRPNKIKKTKKFVEAIYPYESQQSGDLRLNVGDKIEVLEVLSESWLKGRCNGQIGVFPSNYVKPLNSYNINTNNNNNNNSVYRPSAPLPNQQYNNNEKISNHNNNSNYTQIASPPQLQSQKPPKKHNHQFLHQFGSRLGNAIIWGAGSKLGQDLVNSAFDKLHDREIKNENE
ncbi:Lsb1p PWA37_004799 [Arxiozyma heterogenica]|uniref:SH3 domain-containing protein n=1 Tax=Arxiozyma heterogenica TaxID=278026 RepID=A0AAN7WQ85_9SACH|nr:hypothetical protein RI543_001203 [Kazachstania heterogenica]